MKNTKKKADVIIIGGGFYGASLALALRKYYQNILVLEKETQMLTQASYVNQATIHNGYHYPRSYLTALRSKVNFPRFIAEYGEAIFTDYNRIYAVARHNSKISARQFLLFCERIGVPIALAPISVTNLFNEQFVASVFAVQEYAFNAAVLRDSLQEKMAKAHIQIQYNAEVVKVSEQHGTLAVEVKNGDTVTAAHVLLCVYANTNTVLAASGLSLLPMKREMTEVALIAVPKQLQQLGITVVDGPFFATMPFPTTSLHSFTHVRYTPQKTFAASESSMAYQPASNFAFMLHDAQRYLPSLVQATYQRSLYTVKTVLPQNERDDGRPILYRKDYGFKNFSVVLGGKIDNIYDIFAAMGL